jgi:hypothetical protein
MSNRRMDAIFFGLFLVVSGVGYFLANRPTDEQATRVVPDFSLPELVYEIPFEFPYAIMKFETRVAPKLELTDGMESALGEVRSALLKSSTVQAVESKEEWVAALD